MKNKIDNKEILLCCIKNSVVIDPACCSVSLLLKPSKILGKDNVRNGFYGQEINLTTYISFYMI